MKAKSKRLRRKIQNFLEPLWNKSTQPKPSAHKEDKGVARRDFLKWSALASTGASIAGALSAPAIVHAETRRDSATFPRDSTKQL
jgi:hypothetical protein